MKNEDWAKIYQYIAHHRLKHLTPQKVGKRGGKRGDKTLKKMMKNTEVMFGNKTFKWDQVWRRMRVAGAIVEVQPGELSESYF